MKFFNKHFTLTAILLSAISLFAQDASTSLATAQKAYVAGNWKNAAIAYEKACPLQPAEKQPECLLWNILALSQTGDAASFKKAGKRLDSLLQKVSPQEALYTDLMMTSAQFRLYLGKYDLAAQDLIHAIETSKPQHNVVLQKVCTAVKTKINNETLNERCELLKQPDSLAAKVDTIKASPADTVIKTEAAPKTKPDTTLTPATPVTETKVSVEKPTAPVATEKPVSTAEEYWVLQLGAFSVKDNALLLSTTLKKRKIQTDIAEQQRGEKTLYLVQTGRFKTREEAVDFGAKELAPLKVEFQPLLRK